MAARSTIHAELALDAEGKFLAVRLQGYGNLGAYITGVAPGPLSLNTGKNLASVYRTPLLGVDIKTRADQHHADGRLSRRRPARGQLLHGAADRPRRRRDGHQPADACASATSSSRRNCRSPPPPASPMTAAISPACSPRRWRFPTTPISPSARRRATSTASCAASRSAPISKSPRRPSGELGKITFEPDGSVKLTTGTLDYGQGHATPFAQVLSAQLGVPFEKITLEQSDSDLVRFGNGTGGSRSITATGQAIVEASALVVAKGKQAAAHLMEASEGDIEFAQRPLHHRRHRPLDRHHGAGAAHARGQAAGGRARHRSTSITPPRTRRRPSPMAAMSPKSRSIPKPA